MKRWLGRMLDLKSDLRYTLRGLRRQPGFTLTVTLTLGLGIGANVAMFSATDRLMLRPFPYLQHPASTHRIYFQTTVAGRRRGQYIIPYPRYLDIRRFTRSFSRFAGVTEWRLAVGDGDASAERQVAGVSASFFDLFDARPALGRYFANVEDSIPRGANVSVLSYAYWQSEFGGRDVVGERLRVGPLLTTVIGVAPKGFVGVSEGEAPAVFMPITTIALGVNQGGAEHFPTMYNWDWMSVVAQRRPGVSIEQANADLTHAYALSRDAQRMTLRSTLSADRAHPVAIAGPLKTAASPVAGLESRTLLWVDGVAMIVLLIACANVVNLILARVFSRRRELAVRLALGVSRRRLAAHFFTEGAILAGLGCAAGVVIAQSLWVALRAMIIREASADALATDWRSLGAACAFAALAAFALSVAPEFLAAREDVASILRAGMRADDRHGSRVRGALLVAQAALSVVLLVGAGLFVRSLINARNVRLGWNPERVLVVHANYRGLVLDSVAQAASQRALIEAAQAIPGVRSVAHINSMPFATSYRPLFVDGIDSVQRLGRFNYQATTPEYFDVTGTRIVRGRAFTAQDRGAAARVAVVSQSMARALWPGADPIDKCFRIDADSVPCTRVIGVAEDVVQQSISDTERLLYYFPDESTSLRYGRLWIRLAAGDPAVQRETVRRALQGVMPAPGYVTVSLLEDVVDTQRRSWALGATMFVAFGALALIVASVGLHGVIGYGVTQRVNELAVRAALGAQRGDIVRLVMAQAVSLVGVGLALGTAGAFVASRWVTPLLFEESATDPVVFGAVAAVLGIVTLVASAGPAARAAAAQPSEALRA